MTDIAKEVREAAARVCDEQAETLLARSKDHMTIGQIYWAEHDEYASENLADAAKAIRALPLPDDPRDAEIERLREALRRHAIKNNEECEECGGFRPHLEPVIIHEPGCLAAPTEEDGE